MSTVPRAFGVETLELDLPPVVGGFGRRLHDAGVPVSAERSARFAAALRLVRPVARRRLYWTARAVFVSDPAQVMIFDRVFAEVFGTGAASNGEAMVIEDVRQVPLSGADDDRPVTDQPGAHGDQHDDAWAAGAAPAPSRSGNEPADQELPVGVLASDEEIIRAKRFEELDAAELAELYRLMSRLQLATPERRTRRAERCRRGATIDMRRTLRGSLRTGGDPIRLARRRRRVVRRRLVLLCDISGSMEPYARAYLQFLTCAAQGGDGHTRSEAFVFATRLTRLTRALHSRDPGRAIQRAAATAPDWSSGTRIGDALKAFNDRHGRRGMARGAVVVILSDGWERGDPALVGREMERLSRLAYRIVWVNPRVAAAGFVPRAGGMTAALPWCDALVSGHSLQALEEVVDAIGARRSRGRPGERAALLVPGPAGAVSEEETWPSATPVPGSSVAMPSGYGPSRGRTTPGWTLGGGGEA
ncbi:MAG: vWA domain-containing protein [Solirubrobacteraceae bacterium]